MAFGAPSPNTWEQADYASYFAIFQGPLVVDSSPKSPGSQSHVSFVRSLRPIELAVFTPPWPVQRDRMKRRAKPINQHSGRRDNRFSKELRKQFASLSAIARQWRIICRTSSIRAPRGSILNWQLAETDELRHAHYRDIEYPSGR